MRYKLFLSGVPGDLSEANLEEKFIDILKIRVKCNLPFHRKHQWKNQGFGTVSTDSESSYNFLKQIGKLVLGTRTISFCPYMTQQQLEERRVKLTKCRVFIHAANLSDFDLYTIFGRYGPVENAYAIKNMNTKQYLNYGYVLFKYERSATKALQDASIFIGDVKLSICKFIREHAPLSNRSRQKTDKEISSIPWTYEKVAQKKDFYSYCGVSDWWILSPTQIKYYVERTSLFDHSAKNILLKRESINNQRSRKN